MTDSRIICMVGTYPRETDWPLTMDPGVEFWAANEAVSLPFPGGVNRVFQLHPRDWREAERRFLSGGELPAGLDPDCFGRTAGHVERLRACAAPVYCLEAWPDLPTAVVYPFGAVMAKMGVPPLGKLYATSTFGYMMALALSEHLEAWSAEGRGEPSPQARISEIRLSGIELPLGTLRERVWEWPNLAYYLGLAVGLGITITLPPGGSSLLNAPLYAVESPFLPDDPDHWWQPTGQLELNWAGGRGWEIRRGR